MVSGRGSVENLEMPAHFVYVAVAKLGDFAWLNAPCGALGSAVEEAVSTEPVRNRLCVWMLRAEGTRGDTAKV